MGNELFDKKYVYRGGRLISKIIIVCFLFANKHLTALFVWNFSALKNIFFRINKWKYVSKQITFRGTQFYNEYSSNIIQLNFRRINRRIQLFLLGITYWAHKKILDKKHREIPKLWHSLLWIKKTWHYRLNNAKFK